jgi:hemin uptake protein HemP
MLTHALHSRLPSYRSRTVTTDPPRDPLSESEHRLVNPQREVSSTDLMQGNREIVIRHGQEAYRLSVTRSGKLILRK